MTRARAPRAPPVPLSALTSWTPMPAPRTRAPSTTTGSDALLYLLFGALGTALAFGTLAWLTGNLTNALVGAGPWAPFTATDALFHPHVLWPHLTPTAVLLGARIIPGLLSVALAVTGVVLWLRCARREERPGPQGRPRPAAGPADHGEGQGPAAESERQGVQKRSPPLTAASSSARSPPAGPRSAPPGRT